MEHGRLVRTREAVAEVLAGFGCAPDWLPEQAPCIEVGTEAFYPDRGERLDAVRAVCAGCPVRECCAVEAIALADDHGVWGGLSGRQRRQARRLWRRGLPLDKAIELVTNR